MTGDARVVDAEPVAVRVAVGEQAPLEHLVRRRADARNEVARVEGGLLDIREVVVRVPVEHELADFDQRVVGIGPDLCEVERVDAVAGSLGGGHDLNLERPRGIVTTFDRLEQIAVVGLRVCAGKHRSFLGRERRDALVGLEVVLDVELPASALVQEKVCDPKPSIWR